NGHRPRNLGVYALDRVPAARRDLEVKRSRPRLSGSLAAGGALARREDVRHGEWRVRMHVEERVRPAESAQPPAEKLRYANGEEAERERRRRIRRERSDGGSLEDPAKRCAERIVPGTTTGIVVHERMNDADNREARTGGIADRAPA